MTTIDFPESDTAVLVWTPLGLRQAALCSGTEAVVPSLYARIIEGFASAGIAPDRLEFFTLHVECDDGHADTMLEILERMMARSPTARQAAIAAGKQVVEARLRMFDALLDGRS
jgi:pyrroloquinoline quinone (PQQ) biosynthesis protein C